MLLNCFWSFDFPPFMVLIIAILNDGNLSNLITTWWSLHGNIFFLVHWLVSILIIGTIMTISKDRVKPSPLPDSWKLSEIFATGVILGTYLALMTVIFFLITYETNFFPVRIFLFFLLFLSWICDDMNMVMKYSGYSRTILVWDTSAPL